MVSSAMSPYLAMCLIMTCFAGVVAVTQFQYGTPAAVAVLLAMGII
jgi:hypothetical protein